MKLRFKLIEQSLRREDIELSNEYDSEGNLLSSEQAEFFKNSKVRDEQGRLLVCYHGTKNPGFQEFEPQYAKSQFGNYKFKGANVNYFASNKNSAEGYTELGYEKDGNVYTCYLNIVNPYIVDNETQEEIRSWRNIKDKKLREKQIKYFKRVYAYWQYNEDWDYFDIISLNDDFAPLGFFFKEEDDGYYSLWEMEKNTMWGAEHEIIPGYTLTEFFEDDDLYDEMYEHIIGDKENEDDYFFNTDEIVKYVLLMNQEDKANYDGIIIPDIIDVGPTGSPFTSFGTDVITLKSSNQIKSITNKVPTNSNNINEDVEIQSWRQCINLLLGKLKEYNENEIIKLIYAHKTDVMPTTSPFYITKDGGYIDVDEVCANNHFDGVGIHSDLLCIILEKIYYDKIQEGDISYEDWFSQTSTDEFDVDDLTDAYLDKASTILGWVRGNPGTEWIENRLYFVIPYNATDAQLRAVRDCLEELEDTKHEYQAYFLNANGETTWHVKYSFWKTPDMFLRIMRNYVNNGKKPIDEKLNRKNKKYLK